ncbi:DUF6197 family protein [Streptomyces zhihengii]
MTPVLKVLSAAIEEIEERGHNKGAYTCPTGAVCTAGALSVAATGHPVPPESPADMPDGLWDALCVVSELVDSVVVDEDPIERIAEWNDRVSTAPDMVVAVLREAIEKQDSNVIPFPVRDVQAVAA